MPFEPFLRWAGGKTWLVPHLQDIIGTTEVYHYHEPFLGGAAIFFNTEHSFRAYLSDTNDELINTYICVRDMPEDVIRIVQTYEDILEVVLYHVSGELIKKQLQTLEEIFNQMDYQNIG